VVSRQAEKDLRGVPRHVAGKLRAWIRMVQVDGLEQTRKIPGFHDEPLHGQRRGQRSIRLNRQYRAIYVVKSDGKIEFVTIEEVTPHEY
jgi:toxin HigB-1